MFTTFLENLAEAVFKVYWKEIEKLSDPGVKAILEKSNSFYRLIYILGFLEGSKLKINSSK